jgi:addiction module RelE/StbE family toxin
MKFKVKYFTTAKQDREEIKQYLNQFSSSASGRLFSKIRHRMEHAKENPYMYRAYESRPQFRCITVEDYLVFYKVNEMTKTLEVHHILHGMINIEQNLTLD